MTFSESYTCASCSLPADGLGGHALCCASSGLYRRHNTLRDPTAELLRQAGIPSALEVSLPVTADRPADIFVPYGLGSRPLALDISIVHTFSGSRHHAEPSAGRAATDQEKTKEDRSKAACDSAGWDFTPVVSETTGAWGKKAQSLFNTLARKIALRSGTSIRYVSQNLWTSVSCALARGVAEMILASTKHTTVSNSIACAPVYPHSASSGISVRPTTSVPTLDSGIVEEHHPLRHIPDADRVCPGLDANPVSMIIDADDASLTGTKLVMVEPSGGEPPSRGALVLVLPGGSVEPLTVRPAS